jgi:hypothetical protein
LIAQIRTAGGDVEHGTVNGMLPDFRFVLGAILALTMLAVGGLGLVTSVRLVREAHMAPLDESRSLAFAGHAEWNQFYDPDAARRYEALAGKTEAPVAEARLEPPAETPAPAPPETAPPAIAQPAPEEQTAALPAHQPEPAVATEVAPVGADDKAPEKTPDADPVPSPAQTTAPNGERVASLPASPGLDLPEETRTPPQEAAPAQPQAAEPQATPPQAAEGQPQDSTPPTPRARPKLHIHRRLARARIRTIPAVTQQPPETSGFPAPWPGYDNQFTGTTTKTNAGKLTGR